MFPAPLSGLLPCVRIGRNTPSAIIRFLPSAHRAAGQLPSRDLHSLRGPLTERVARTANRWPSIGEFFLVTLEKLPSTSFELVEKVHAGTFSPL